MTRDEAVKKAHECFRFDDYGQQWSFTPLRLVAALENLGLLKLEEPKGAGDRVWELLGDQAAGIIGRLDHAGFKIVEK